MPVPIEVTEDFSEYRFSRESPYTAERSFTVTGTSDPDEALSAVDTVTGLAIPQANEPIRPNSPLLCSGPKFSGRPSPDFFKVRCDYAIPKDGQWPTELSPLAMPPSVAWGHGEIMLPTDIDLDGRPIINAAASPFSPPSRRVTFKQFTIFQNEPFFNFAKSEFYENSVNKTLVNLGGGIVVPANKLRCASIIPVDRYYFTQALYVQIAYNFELIMSDALGPHPWQHCFLNAGRNGWTDVGGGVKQPGGFCHKPLEVAETFDADVRLDLSGKPLQGVPEYAELKIKKDTDANFAGEPIANPSPVEFFATERISTSVALGWRVYFKQFRQVEFAGMLAR